MMNKKLVIYSSIGGFVLLVLLIVLTLIGVMSSVLLVLAGITATIATLALFGIAIFSISRLQGGKRIGAIVGLICLSGFVAFSAIRYFNRYPSPPPKTAEAKKEAEEKKVFYVPLGGEKQPYKVRLKDLPPGQIPFDPEGIVWAELWSIRVWWWNSCVYFGIPEKVFPKIPEFLDEDNELWFFGPKGREIEFVSQNKPLSQK